jgi:ketosteroid isomerase-like protein
MSASAKNLALARSYVQSIERGAAGTELKAFFAPGVEFVVFPNLLMPKGDRQNLAAALEGAERGWKVMARQKYLIRHEMVDGDRVTLEVEWVGTLSAPFGTIPAGGQMRANFAVFLEFRKRKIVGQRNYDCYEAW